MNLKFEASIYTGCGEDDIYDVEGTTPEQIALEIASQEHWNGSGERYRVDENTLREGLRLVVPIPEEMVTAVLAALPIARQQLKREREKQKAMEAALQERKKLEAKLTSAKANLHALYPELTGAAIRAREAEIEALEDELKQP